MLKILIISLIAAVSSFNADKPAYKLYDNNGKLIEYNVMTDSLKNADIILFGEFHDNPISHWLQYEVTNDLNKLTKGNIMLGAEMFEADNQTGVDNYLIGKSDEKKFEGEVRLWPNYKTDYKPLMDYAKANHFKFIATNIPRTYANLVFKGGFEALDSLDKKEKEYIAPLPILYQPELKCYKKMLEMSMHGAPNENFPKAQAIKDATMAHFIMKNLDTNKVFIHYHGAYHSDNYEGIMWYLKIKNKNLKILTISTVTQQSVDALEEENKHISNFIICVPETMTRTH